ncbi:LysR family transcriptional regulator [Jannaschia pohangensis]|uniref:DNA-binding transcriptional regulator, LysR family n=1 Tax=Jannaschia pohangensis TaxID=390807 RepID=A0A1I3IP31_9RHOB|nr:LysR family transcriptional regulator [Jannaschia pohangensis]SFI49649.1 DNA-binding transcriptional regulator, LysR family [Jannaschia pohangensis]
MDITLIRTFLEVSATGSFVSASARLFVTQSAVSLRVQRLEEALGHPLFTRSKAGAELTPAGKEFERYALSMVKIWAEARQQIAIPDGFSRSLTIGAQYSLWPRLGFRWIDALRRDVPDLSLHAEIGMPDRLTRFLVEGVVQTALMYTPQMRPGLRVEELLADELILVAGWARPEMAQVAARYVYVDWGAEFTQAHAIKLPDLCNSGVSLTLGALAADFIANRGLAGYVPARYAKRALDAGVLHLVADAPTFHYPAWVVWREDVDETLAAQAAAALTTVVAEIDRSQSDVLSELALISEDHEVETFGSSHLIFHK